MIIWNYNYLLNLVLLFLFFLTEMCGRIYKMCSASENDFYRNYDLNNGAVAVEIIVK